jgi:hypothetical protein
MTDDYETLTTEFRKLGLERPERWASSQIKEGIPQLQRARLLFKFWHAVVSHTDPSWIDRQRRRFAMSEKAKPGSGNRNAPHVAAIDRILAAGVSLDELTTVVREMQITLLSHICVMLDDSGAGPTEAAGTNFGVFELDRNNTPIRPLEGLHESVYAFNREAAARRRATDEKLP